MGLSYNLFSEAFLDKVTEYDFPIDDHERNGQVDRYMKRALTKFDKVCKYDLLFNMDDVVREFVVVVDPIDIDNIVDIVSEGMLVQWMKPYVYKQENLENVLNTRDFSAYSPAELLYRIRETYDMVKRDFSNMIKDYSYNNGDLTDLFL